MSNIYFTVGPSQAYPTIDKHIQSALKEEIISLNHRGKSFTSLYQSAEERLKELLSIPTEYSVFFLSSGTEGMEKVIQNTVEKYSYHIITGTFGDRFYQTAKELGKVASSYFFNPTEGFRAADVVVPENAELIAFTHNDTSTGMQIPMSEIYAIGKQNPDALIAVDTVSSMPAVDIDYPKVDAVFFSVQKGFGMPAGHGVLIVSPRAIEKAKKLSDAGVNIGSYHNFIHLQKYAQKFQTPDTPNVLGIYLLNKILGDFLELGIHTIRQSTKDKSTMMYDFFKNTDRYSPLVSDIEIRSDTTLVVQVKGGSKDIIENLKKQGIIIGSGYGENKNDHIRIANFPAHTLDDVNHLITALKNM